MLTAMDDKIKNATREDYYDFVPDKLVMGKFKADDDADDLSDVSRQFLMYAAIPSCRYMNHSWTQLHKFSKLTGFKPNVQRDCEKELDKAATNACEEIENVPVSGIKIVSLDANPYCYYGKEYDYSGDALVYDPRGFTIQIPLKHLSMMIDENNGNISDYALTDVKYVYISSSSGMTLIPYESDRCQQIIAKQNACKDENGKVVSIKPSQLEVGHAYVTSDVFEAKYKGLVSGTYIFAGRQDTYSLSLIRTALSENQYPKDIDSFIKNNSSYFEHGEKTHKNAYVFFLAVPKATLGNGYGRTFRDSIIVLDSPSKLFAKEVPVDADWKWWNQPDKPLNITTIKEFMDSNPYFTKIDLDRSFSHLEYEELSVKNFCRIAASLNYDNLYHDNGCDFETTVIPYPFTYTGHDDSDNGILSSKFSMGFRMSIASRYGYTGSLPSCKILKDENTAGSFRLTGDGLIFTAIVTDYYRPLSTTETCRNQTISDVYDKFKPIVPKIYLENGRQLDQLFFSTICNAWLNGYENINKNSWFSSNHSSCNENVIDWNKKVAMYEQKLWKIAQIEREIYG